MIKFQVLVTYRAPNLPQRQQRFNALSMAQAVLIRDREVRSPTAVTAEISAILETWVRTK